MKLLLLGAGAGAVLSVVFGFGVAVGLFLSPETPTTSSSSSSSRSDDDTPDRKKDEATDGKRQAADWRRQTANKPIDVKDLSALDKKWNDKVNETDANGVAVEKLRVEWDKEYPVGKEVVATGKVILVLKGDYGKDTCQIELSVDSGQRDVHGDKYNVRVWCSTTDEAWAATLKGGEKSGETITVIGVLDKGRSRMYTIAPRGHSLTGCRPVKK